MPDEKEIVLLLCNRTNVMALPWAKAGYRCICVDLQHGSYRVERFEGGGSIEYARADVRKFKVPPGKYKLVCAFPPCTDLAVSGAKHFRSKGLRSLVNALDVVCSCAEICESIGAPYMLENPVSVISSYWRDPDCTFHPFEYGLYAGGESDTYNKRTCLWVGNGFNVPQIAEIEPIDKDRIHRMGPSEDRGDLRAVTPGGFAQAVFEYNHARLEFSQRPSVHRSVPAVGLFEEREVVNA